ncbi:MAG: rhodanese-like domain-containing protein [Zavarzinella sp.]
MIKQIHPTQAAELLAQTEDVLLVDVREPWEYEYAHIHESILIPLGELSERHDELDLTKPIIVYCHHGVRSLSGAAILQQHGAANVASMAGGIDAWSRLIDPKIPKY